MVRTLVEDAAAREREQASRVEHAERAHAYAHAVQAGTHEELCHWSAMADSYAERLEGALADLRASRYEATQLRDQNAQLHDQNAQLRAHCEELRELLMRSGVAADLAPSGVVVA